MKQAQPLHDLTHTEEKDRADQDGQPRDRGGGRGETRSLGARTLSSLTTPLDTQTRYIILFQMKKPPCTTVQSQWEAGLLVSAHKNPSTL